MQVAHHQQGLSVLRGVHIVVEQVQGTVVQTLCHKVGAKVVRYVWVVVWLPCSVVYAC